MNVYVHCRIQDTLSACLSLSGKYFRHVLHVLLKLLQVVAQQSAPYTVCSSFLWKDDPMCKGRQYIFNIYIYRYDVCAYCAYVYMWLHFFCMFFLGGRDRWCNILGVCYCPNSWVTSWPCQPFLWCPRIVGQEIPSTWRRLPWQWPNDLGNGLGVDVESILNQSSRWEFKIVHVRVLTLDRFSTVTFFFPHLCGIFVGGLHKFAWPLCSISWSWLHHITIIYYLSIVHHLLSSKAPSLDARMMLRMMPGV